MHLDQICACRQQNIGVVHQASGQCCSGINIYITSINESACSLVRVKSLLATIWV